MRYLYLLLFLVAAPLSAQPYMYWADYSGGSIGRADIDGSNANHSFLPGLNGPAGITIDGTYIYWADYSGTTIGRANLDGSNVNHSFISGANTPIDVLVAGAYVYWANYTNNSIGRANLDGSNVNHSFISGASAPAGITVDDTYIYWTNWGSDAIGRATLDGSDANQNFIASASRPVDITVDGTYIYWTNEGINMIERANLDGSNVNQSFISNVSSYGLTIDGPYIYWTESDGTIGRANLDGSNVTQSLVSGGVFPWGIVTTNSGSLPVELTSFTATLDGASALLRWETASETNNAGFDVELRNDGSSFQSVGFAAGRGTTAEATRYSHRVEGLQPGTHTFRLKQVDFDGAFEYSPDVELTVDADGLALAIFGNPASGTIRGSVVLPNAQPARVRLFDVLGREVRAQDGVAGTFSLDVSGLSSGSYVLRVEAGAQTLTRSIVVAQ